MNLKSIPELQIEQISEIPKGLVITRLETLANTSEVTKKLHKANFYELLLVTGGSGSILVDSHKYVLSPNIIFATSSGPVKKFSFGKDITGYALLFTPDFLNKYPEDLVWMNSLTLFDSLNCFTPIEPTREIFGDLINIIKKTETELNSSGFASREILYNAVKTIIILSERTKRLQPAAVIRNGGNSLLVSRFKHLLEENYISRRMVSFYADNLNITPRKLSKVVSEHYGKSAKQVIEERILLEIKRLIIHTDKNIKEIGHNLGFSDPTNFNKFFKRYTNHTPADFRLLHNDLKSTV